MKPTPTISLPLGASALSASHLPAALRSDSIQAGGKGAPRVEFLSHPPPPPTTWYTFSCHRLLLSHLTILYNHKNDLHPPFFSPVFRSPVACRAERSRIAERRKGGCVCVVEQIFLSHRSWRRGCFMRQPVNIILGRAPTFTLFAQREPPVAAT